MFSGCSAGRSLLPLVVFLLYSVPLRGGPSESPGSFAPVLQFTAFTSSTSSPSDVAGAVGPAQYLAAADGRLRTFDKSSGAADGAIDRTVAEFFGVPASDPMIRYDRLSARWFVVALFQRPMLGPTGGVIFATTADTVLTPTSSWTRSWYLHPLAEQIFQSSFAVDRAHLYVGVTTFHSWSNFRTIVEGIAFSKTSVVAGAPAPVAQYAGTAVHHILGPVDRGCGRYQGVDNDDPAAPYGYLVSIWSSTFPSCVPDTLLILRIDLVTREAITVKLPLSAPAAPIAVRQPGASPLVPLTGFRIRVAQLRGERLFIAHDTAVNASGLPPGPADPAATANGIRWIVVDHPDDAPVILHEGLLARPATDAGQRSFSNGSIAVSGQQHLVVGGSSWGPSDYVNGVAAARLSDDPGTLRDPIPLSDASEAYAGETWSGWSSTTVDPEDNMTIWTIQTYAVSSTSWAAVVAKLSAPPPATPVRVTPSTISPGAQAARVTVTGVSIDGSGFFDPGEGFPKRLTARIAGINVTAISQLTPTSFVMELAVPPDATGTRDLEIVNPDGQVVRLAAALQVQSSTPAMALDAPRTGSTVRQPFHAGGWAVDAGPADGPGIDWVQIYLIPPSGTPLFLGAAERGPRPDVAAIYGAAYLNAGFGLTVRGVPPGPYTLVAFAHSARTGGYDIARAAPIVIESGGMMAIDAPARGAILRQPFLVGGWAADTAASAGVGCDVVHAYAVPATGSPIFLGAALVEGRRPDVAAIFGGQFERSGYGLTVSGLPPGQYDLVVFAFSAVSQSFSIAQSIPITIPASDPRTVIDLPLEGSVQLPFVVSGWAVDTAGPVGQTGIDAIRISARPVGGGPDIVLGPVAVNGGRPDVAAVFGPDFEGSGYSVTVTDLPAGSYDLVVTTRAVLTGTFSSGELRRIVVPGDASGTFSTALQVVAFQVARAEGILNVAPLIRR